MADPDLAFAGLAGQAEAVRAGEVSPRELVELYLERIERLEPQLNAFRVVRAERALAEAAEAEKRRPSDGEAPLYGVPIAVKDSQDVAGELTTHGTGCVDVPAAEDSEMVRRLRAAGAIVIGKTNLPELAFAMFTESPTWGVTRNPWNTEPGSRRLLRRQRRRRRGGPRGRRHRFRRSRLDPLPGRLLLPVRAQAPARACPVRPRRRALARDVRERLPDPHRPRHGALSRRHRRRRPGADKPPPPERPFVEAARTPPGKLRVAVSVKGIRALAPPMLDERCRRAVEETAELLGSLGHQVTWRDPDWGMVGNGVTILYSRGVADDARRLPNPERLGRQVRGVVRMGSLIPDGVVRRARAATAKHAKRIYRIFEDHDVLLLPVVGEPPVPVEKWSSRGGQWTLAGMTRRTGFGPPWNYLGNPAAAVPAGFTDDGLPLSVQLVGRPNDEATLLSLAAQLESERPWADRRPPLIQ